MKDGSCEGFVEEVTNRSGVYGFCQVGDDTGSNWERPTVSVTRAIEFGLSEDDRLLSGGGDSEEVELQRHRWKSFLLRNLRIERRLSRGCSFWKSNVLRFCFVTAPRGFPFALSALLYARIRVMLQAPKY